MPHARSPGFIYITAWRIQDLFLMSGLMGLVEINCERTGSRCCLSKAWYDMYLVAHLSDDTYAFIASDCR